MQNNEENFIKKISNKETHNKGGGETKTEPESKFSLFFSISNR